MITTVKKRKQGQTVRKTKPHLISIMYEIVAFCPGCKTIETLSFENGRLIQSRKFTQEGDKVFHSCGTQDPCRLLGLTGLMERSSTK